MPFGLTIKSAGCAIVALALGGLFVAPACAAPTAEQTEKLHAAAKAMSKAEASYKSGKPEEAIAAFRTAQESLVELGDAKEVAKQVAPLVKRLVKLRDKMKLDGADAPEIAVELPQSEPPVATPGSRAKPGARGASKSQGQVSAEQPVGWRGDGAGRFPRATPPLEWYRRPKGAFNAILVQTARPKGRKPSGQPLDMGTIREWLVAGPFDAKDHATALDEVSPGNEATLQPAAGEQLLGKPWQVMSVSVGNQSQSWGRLVLDLAQAYGMQTRQESQNHPGTLESVVAYACAYLYSAEAGQVRLRIEATPAKAWLNGAPLKIAKDSPLVVELAQGWNQIMVKVASTSKNWNMSTLVYPVAGASYETKNIRWMAPMPGPSWSSPIVVGAKVFVNADQGTLVCLNKDHGTVLWTRSLTYYHAVSPEERGAFPNLAPKAQELDQIMQSLPDDLNAGLSVDGSLADGNAALHEKIKKKLDLENEILQTMSKGNRKYLTWSNDRGWSTATPVSDGQSVYVIYYGGQKGLGANVVACYDLNGKCRWSHFTGQTDIGEHGQHSTPALCGDHLVLISGSTLYAFDKATGKIVWQKKTRGFTVTGASPIALKAGSVNAVWVPQVGIFNIADGTELWKSDVTHEIVTPSIINGVAYGITERNNTTSYYALQLPLSNVDAPEPTLLVKTPWKEIGLDLPGTFTNTIIGPPLYDNGLCYIVSEGGALAVVEANTGKPVYAKMLETLEPRLTWVFSVGICTGPTLAGKTIHIRDDQAQTLVIAPGREYKELAKNVLWELMPNGNQQEAQSNPFYEGNRIYYRTQGFLYCIGEK